MIATPGGNDRARRILELMEQGLSFEDIAARMMPEEDNTLLRRLAWLRRIDRAAFAVATGDTARDSAAARLETLCSEGRLKEISGEPGIYRLRDDLRAAQLKLWQVTIDPVRGELAGVDLEEFREFHKNLARHFESLGAGAEIDWLYHLLAADADAGLELMDTLLRERLPQADENSEGALDATLPGARDGIALGRAFDVLEVVASQLAYLPARALESYKSAQRLVETWAEWCDAWYRTRRYVPRERVHRLFLDLLQQNKKRILEISAPGGSGKTMVLRWLITSHCIPRRKIVAHLDFDHFHGQQQRPWQLLLRCAEQLDRQLAGAPFQSLIGEGREIEVALRAQRNNANVLDEARLDAFAVEFVHRFRSVLISSRRKAVLFIVDTFEEAMIRGLTPVPAFIALLADLAAAIPAIRIIVSGRYSLEHRGFSESVAADHPAAAQFYAAHLQRERLRQFDAAEADLYLRRRGVELSKENVARLIAAARTSPDSIEMQEEVSPFHLSLIADLIQGRGQEAGLDFDDLLHDVSQVQVIYLIERVIARIDDVGVRWLLRYGVVPRHLTFEFFSEVLVPYLQRVHQGSSELDDPARDPLPAKLQEKALFFSDSQVLREGPDRLWKRLEAFASADSWVEAVEGGKAFVFHTCARDPMRALLRSHPVLRAIHEKAAKYFEVRADTAGSPEEKLAHLREVVYHRLQWQDPGALAFCQDLLERHRGEEDFDLLLGLSQEIVSDEYRPVGEPPLVDQTTLKIAMRGRFDAAVVLADLELGSTKGHTHLEDARKTIIEWVHLGGLDRTLLESRLEAREGYRRQDLELARTVLEAALPAGDTETQTSLALLQLAAADPRSVEAFAALLTDRLRNPKLASLPKTAFLVVNLLKAFLMFGGSSALWAALNTAVKTPWTFTFGSKLRHAIGRATADLLLVWGRGGATTELVRRSGLSGEPAFTLREYFAEASSHPHESLRKIDTWRRTQVIPAQISDHSLAESFIYSAAIRSTLCQHQLMAQDLTEAARLYEKYESNHLAAVCLLKEVEFQVIDGNPEGAERAMARRQRSLHSGPNQAPETLKERLLRFQIAARLDRATEKPVDLLSAAEAVGILEDRLHCVYALLADAKRAEIRTLVPRLVDLLLATLKRLPDMHSRFFQAWLLRAQRESLRLELEQEKRLVALLTVPGSWSLFGEKLETLDLSWSGLWRAHMLRIFGRADLAHPMVRYAHQTFENASSLTGLREVWQLQALLDGDHPEVSLFLSLRGASPKLEEAIAVEQAEHALRRRDPSTARQWLADFQGPLAGTLRTRIIQFENTEKRTSLAVLSEDDKSGTFLHAMPTRGDHNMHVYLDRGGNPELLPSITSTAPEPQPDSLWQNYPHQTLELGPPGRSAARPRWTEGSIAFALEHSGNEAVAAELGDGYRAAPHGLANALARFPDRFELKVFPALLADLGPWRGGPRRDLAIVGEHLGGAGMPWELGSASGVRLVYRRLPNDRHRHLWLQKALRAAGAGEAPLSGEWDAAIAKALRELANRLGTDDIGSLKRELRKAITKAATSAKPRVVILQAAKRSQIKAQRGLDFGSAEIENLYQRHGFQAETLFGVGLAEFLWANPRLPTIVHVYAPYVERTTTGDVLPDLGHEVPRGTPQLHPQELRDAIPLLILDGPGEPDPTEQVRQIFLRNAAATLFAKEGTFQNILGIGLDPQPDFSSLEKLLDGILKGKSLYELHHGLREGAPDLTAESLHKNSGRLAPALWTPDPDLCILLGDPP